MGFPIFISFARFFKIFSALLLLIASTSGKASPLPNFTDLALQTCLDQQAFQSGWTQAEDVVTFNCVDRNVTSIAGIDQLVNLQQLDLSDNNIVDVHPLLSFTNLTTLKLSGNRWIDFNLVTDILNQNTSLTRIGLNGIAINAGLPLLTNTSTGQPYALIELDLGNTGLTDIINLSQYTTLQIVNLSNNLLDNVAPVAQLLQLQDLNLADNSIFDIQPLIQHLSGLTALNLSGNTAIHFSDVKSLIDNNRSLTRIYINGISVYDRRLPLFSFLQHDTVTELDLGNTGIIELWGIESYTNIQRLNLEGNGLADITLLETLTPKHLNLSNNAIHDVFPLLSMTQLESLYLSGNSAIKDWWQTVLDNNKYLRRIGLNGIALSHVPLLIKNSISGSPYDLIELDLGNTGLNNLYEINLYPDLQKLNLSGLRNADISNISTMPLRELDLSNTSFVDYSILTSFTHLTSLNLSNSQFNDINLLQQVVSQNNRIEIIQLEGIPLNSGPTNGDVTGPINSELISLITTMHFNAQPYKLKQLNIANTRITDFFYLQTFSTLRSLNLSNNPLWDINPLSALDLNVLDISGTGIDTVQPLQNSRHLKSLNLSGLSKMDFSQVTPVLQNNFSLSHIALNNIHINQAFPQLENPVTFAPYWLTSLELNNTGITSLDSLDRYDLLRTLRISGNNIDDLFPLRNMLFSELDLSNNLLYDVSDISTTHLTEINLSGNSLMNYVWISTFIEQNTKLQKINLNGITINGPAPDLYTSFSLGGRPQVPYNLIELDLGNTLLQDISSISQYSMLKKLNLSGNNQTDVSPLSSLALVELDLSNNNFFDLNSLSSGSILTSLEKLNLAGNYDLNYAQVETLLSNNHYLTHLNLSDIHLYNNFPVFNSLHTGLPYALKELILSNCGLTDASNIGQYYSLETLDVSDNKLTNMYGIEGPLYQALNISGNDITDLVPFNSITELRKLDISGNLNIDFNQLRPYLEANPNLSHLLLNDIAINAPLPLLASNATGSPLNLVQLELSNTGVTDLNALFNYSYPGIQSLNLSNNALTDINALSNLPLKELDISYNNLTDLAAISTIYTLESFNVSGNTSIDHSEVMSFIGTNHKLKHIGMNGIYSHNWTFPILTNPQTMRPYGLISLDIGNTGLRDILDLVSYKTLSKVNIENNLFSDVWPLAQFKLTELNLSGNPIADLFALTFVDSLFTLTKLDASNLSDINISQLLAIIQKNNQLTHLTIDGLNGFSDFPQLHSGLGPVQPLLELSIKSAGLLNINGIELYSSLRRLDLSDNNLTEINHLFSLINLEHINLTGNISLQCIDIENLVAMFGSSAVIAPSSCITGTAPSLSILDPLDGSTFSQTDIIILSANANDIEQGDLSSIIQWTSSIDGFVGEGAQVFTKLSPGTHTLTASVTDAENNLVIQDIQLNIIASPPTITGLWSKTPVIGESLSVFVFGNSFTTDGTTSVSFNGTPQPLVSVISSEILVVRVTVDPTLFGLISISTPSGLAVSSEQFGLPASALSISGIWPGLVQAGTATSIFIFGNGFATDGSSEVYFNGIRQFTVAPVSSELLIVRITPDLNLSGTVTVTNPGTGSASSTDDLIVTP